MFWLKTIYFTNDLTGWAAGEYGKMFRTTDAGNNWVLQSDITHAMLTSMTFVSPMTGWIVGETGTIFKTTKGSLDFNH